MVRRAAILLLPLLLATSPVYATDPTSWMLMERHGACIPLEKAAERLEALKGANGPKAFAENLRREGASVTVRHLDTGGPAAVEVTAKKRNLAMLFVDPALCPK